MEKNRIRSLFLGGCLLAVNMIFTGGVLGKAFAEEIIVMEEATALEATASAEEEKTEKTESVSGKATSEKRVLQLYAEILRQYDQVWTN